MSVKYELTVKLTDGATSKALVDGAYSLYAGLAHSGEGFHPNHTPLGTPIPITDAILGQEKTVKYTFNAPAAVQPDWWIAYRTAPDQPPQNIKLVTFTQVYKLESSAVLAPFSKPWVTGDRIGFQNDVPVIPCIYRTPPVAPGSTPVAPDINLPWKQLPLWVPGSGLITLPKPVNQIKVWFESSTVDPPDDSDEIGSKDQSTESDPIRWVPTPVASEFIRMATMQYTLTGWTPVPFVPPGAQGAQGGAGAQGGSGAP